LLKRTFSHSFGSTPTATGIWNGDVAGVAAEFGVTEDEAYSTLTELCDRHHLQRLDTSKYIIVGWRERDDQGEKEQYW
jgi:hypothetical protein